MPDSTTPPGSLMARLCVEGNRLFSDLTAHLDVPMRRTGKLVVGFDEEDRAHPAFPCWSGAAGTVCRA